MVPAAPALSRRGSAGQTAAMAVAAFALLAVASHMVRAAANTAQHAACSFTHTRPSRQHAHR